MHVCVYGVCVYVCVCMCVCVQISMIWAKAVKRRPTLNGLYFNMLTEKEKERCVQQQQSLQHVFQHPQLPVATHSSRAINPFSLCVCVSGGCV